MPKKSLKEQPFFTIGLIAVNTVIFLLMSLGGEPDVQEVLDWGACYYPRLAAGESWRLLTAVFLHFSIYHLGGNMIALGTLGWRLEQTIGHTYFLVIYLLSGIGANIASQLIGNSRGEWYVAAGASGAVLGLFGCMLAVLLIRRGFVEGIGLRQMAIAILFILYSGRLDDGTDNTAHIAGIVIGFVLGFLLVKIRQMRYTKS